MGDPQNCAETAQNCAQGDLGPDFIGTLVPNFSWCVRHTAEMKPLRCLLHLARWHTYHNDEGQRYQLCTRCGAYREKYTLTDYKAGSA
jgi:hypothetical protein